jgi:DNA-binding transcriptional ArsR family regulator
MAITQPEVAKAFSHPLRARILCILEERRASPRQLADELGQPLGNVSYHVRTLLGLKLIRLVKKTPRRGSIEHYYEAVAGSNYLSDGTWADTPGIAKRAILDSALHEIGQDVGRSAVLGGFDRSDAHLTRTNLTLDLQAWRDLADELIRLREWALSLERESQERLAETHHQGEVQSGLVMMFYQKLPDVTELTRLADDEGSAPAQLPAEPEAPGPERIPAEASEAPR